MQPGKLLVEAPIFHLAPPEGWVNDPNGPLLYNGRYHLFYQHLGKASSWSWGLSWGHASSSNLVQWQHHPTALDPTPGSYDSDGCFSGCAVVMPAMKAAMLTASNTAEPATQGPAKKGTDNEGVLLSIHSDSCREQLPLQQRGVPVLLYTGVVLRPDAPSGLKPNSLTVSELCIERQLAAVATDIDDPLLLHWKKQSQPWLISPPAGLCLNCFRDPFILETAIPSNNNTWRLMIGAGIRDPETGLACAGDITTGTRTQSSGISTVHSSAETRADVAVSHPPAPALTRSTDLRKAAKGTALVYKSSQLLSGWEFEGQLCAATDPVVQGAVWECPVLAKLPALQPPESATAAFNPAESIPTHFFSVSTGRSPAVYWLGQYADGKFDLVNATGPFGLDLGDLLYAPNILSVPQDSLQQRVLLWGWLSELPTASTHCSTAGCISLPRQLSLSPGGHLVQQPLHELKLLHTGKGWSAGQMLLKPYDVRHIAQHIPSSYFDLELTLQPEQGALAAAEERSSSSCLAGIVLPPWSSTESSNSNRGNNSDTADARVTAVGQGAVLLYDFATCKLCLTIGPDVGNDVLGQYSAKTASEAGAVIDHHDADTSRKVAASKVLQSYLPTSNSSSAECSQSSCSNTSACSNSNLIADLPDGVRQLGGQLRLQPYQPLKLHMFMDFSLLEVYCGDGQVLSTRVYRGVWPGNSSSRGGFSTAGTAPMATLHATAPDAATLGILPGDVLLDASSVANETWARSSEGSVVHANALQTPGGVWLLAGGSGLVAKSVSMHAMGSSWAEDSTSANS